MPYTPPSQRSPAASQTHTPAISRNNSYAKSLEYPVPGVGYFGGPRPGLPRSSSSTSYLSRERRSPTAPRQNPTPDATPIDERYDETKNRTQGSSSLRQSPPPVNDSIIPTGAVLSPPDSTQNSSDDEEPSRGRIRDLENLEELQAAISAIELHREGSPDLEKEGDGRPKLALDLSAASLNDAAAVLSPPLSQEAKKILHSRSNTAPNLIDFTRSATDSPERSSDSDDVDDQRVKKPPMLRKKSGELVRPALRVPHPQRRPSSAPGTPTYNKSVHFSSELESVKTFMQLDRPAAVSAGSSPVDAYESDTEFPFNNTDRSHEPPWEWELRLPNFPSPALNRSNLPVRVERVFLSSDKKTLIGAVAVQNLSYHKSVVARFTFDFWKTTSEVSADYSHDIRKEHEDGCDRFMFNIKLDEQNNLEKKTLFFCVRYSVDGQEFWDSNNFINYQVDFSKKSLPQKGKHGMQGNAAKPLSSLPRSRPSPPVSSGLPRPFSMTNFDDFAEGFDVPFKLGSPPSAVSIIGEKPIKFRNKNSDMGISDASGRRNKSQAQAFGTRYDFGASLSAAAASTDRSEFNNSRVPFSSTKGAKVQDLQDSELSKDDGESQKPKALSEKPALQSQSYNDLINKYCFFGSTKSLPPSHRPGNGRFDGAEDSKPEPEASVVSNAAVTLSETRSSLNLAGQKSPPSSPRISRTSSPALGSSFGSRAASPVSFGYPYNHSMQTGLFETHAPTAILG